MVWVYTPCRRHDTEPVTTTLLTKGAALSTGRKATFEVNDGPAKPKTPGAHLASSLSLNVDRES